MASSLRAKQVRVLVESLQARLVRGLEIIGGQKFQGFEWRRDEGVHGGGQRFSLQDTEWIGRASVNISQVHYDENPTRMFGSATAISAIIHPTLPHMPSVHIHISWTEMKSGAGYWRIMADLNPALPSSDVCAAFQSALRNAAPEQYAEATELGNRYFYIAALGRYRGAIHFYLEDFNRGDFAADLQFAQRIGNASIDVYLELLENLAQKNVQSSDEDRSIQLAYHTLYFFQVLTLDRGTTSGLMVHNQNDIGILGSLPPRVDKNLLVSWLSRMPELQMRLLSKLLATLPNSGICIIDDATKLRLAGVVRAHYQQYPEALDLQASGCSMFSTVENHQ